MRQSARRRASTLRVRAHEPAPEGSTPSDAIEGAGEVEGDDANTRPLMAEDKLTDLALVSSPETDVMARFDRITSNPLRMNGQPCIRALRLTVKRVVEALALYPDREALRAEYPELEDEDIRQALEYAAASLEDELLDLPKTA